MLMASAVYFTAASIIGREAAFTRGSGKQKHKVSCLGQRNQRRPVGRAVVLGRVVLKSLDWIQQKNIYTFGGFYVIYKKRLENGEMFD